MGRTILKRSLEIRLVRKSVRPSEVQSDLLNKAGRPKRTTVEGRKKKVQESWFPVNQSHFKVLLFHLLTLITLKQLEIINYLRFSIGTSVTVSCHSVGLITGKTSFFLWTCPILPALCNFVFSLLSIIGNQDSYVTNSTCYITRNFIISCTLSLDTHNNGWLIIKSVGL